MSDLKDKVAIITGAASGIGKATLARYIEEGARVVATDLNPEIEEICRLYGDQAIGIVGDAGKKSDILKWTETAQSQFGGLDIVFANAGVSGGLAGLFEQDEADWEAILRINLVGPFLLIQAAAPLMKARGGGSIIVTGSVAGLRSGAGGAAYSASKAGVINLVQNAANQLTGAMIRVNAICPGLIETEMTRMLFDMAEAKGKRDKLGYFVPLKRAGQPQEIADVAVFLGSDRSSYINGQAIVVDGGLSSTYAFNRQDYGRIPF